MNLPRNLSFRAARLEPSLAAPGNDPLLAARICPRPAGVKAARPLICGGPLAVVERVYATPLGQLPVRLGVCGRCAQEWLLGTELR